MAPSSRAAGDDAQARQQTNSRMMKTTRRGRPYAKDTHDLFATLIVSLQLITHRQFFKTYHNSFTTDEAAENLSALKFSQSNRAPDPREPSRVVTTTTTTTFSMNRDMAKGICQHFMDARLIENAADPASGLFKDKGVYQLTPKGLHILERFITKNGISAEHLLTVFASQPICMKLLHLERRAHDDELLINRPILEVIFRRFCGRQPNYLPGASGNRPSSPSSTSLPMSAQGKRSASPQNSGPKRGRSGSNAAFDATLGIGLQDIVEKVKGHKQPVRIKHVFPAISVLDWLVDFTTICGRDEAAEIAAHFQRLGYIQLAKDSSRKETEDDSVIVVRGEDGIGRVSEGEFKCHYKCMYGMTDKGRATARWPGCMPAAADKIGTSTIDSRNSQPTSMGQQQQQQQQQQLTPSSSEINLAHPMSKGNDIESLRSQEDSGIGSGVGGSDVNSRPSFGTGRSSEQSMPPNAKSVSTVPFKSQHYISNQPPAAALDPATAAAAAQTAASPGRGSRDAPFVPFKKPSAAEKLRNDYISRGGQQQEYSHSPYNTRDSNTNRLKQVLEEPALRSLFRDFLKQNFCEENLSFWLDVQDFKRRFHTTSSAVAVRPGEGSSSSGRRKGLFNRASSNLNRSGANNGDSSDGGGGGGGSGLGKDAKRKGGAGSSQATQGVTAMEKHQQDLIAMAFVIYNTYLAQASPCELNIEHNLRMELVTYMNRVLKEAKANAGGENGVQTVRAKDLQKKDSQDSGSSENFAARLGAAGGGGAFPDDGGLAAALAGPPPSSTSATNLAGEKGSGGGTSTDSPSLSGRLGGVVRRGTGAGAPGSAPVPMSVEERKSTVLASMPRYPLHASQLQTIVRLYERIQDHIFRLMATDSVPRFIKDARFLGLVKSVAEYTEALESGRLDPNDVSGPAISQNVVDAMELGIVSGGGGVPGGAAGGVGVGVRNAAAAPLAAGTAAPAAASTNGNGHHHAAAWEDTGKV